MVGLIFDQGGISCILVLSSNRTLVKLTLISRGDEIGSQYLIPFLRCVARALGSTDLRIFFPD